VFGLAAGLLAVGFKTAIAKVIGSG
jgi:hypothetical protein